MFLIFVWVPVKNAWMFFCFFFNFLNIWFYFWNIFFYLIHVCLFRIFSYLTLFSFTSQADSSTKDLLNSCQGKAPHHLHLLFLWHETKSVRIAPLTASEKQHIRQRRFHSVPPVNHCLHRHNRGLIISAMICLEKQPWGNQSENSQLASQNNFCAPSPDCRMLLQPSVSVIKNISPSVGAGCGWFVSVFWCLFYFIFFVNSWPQRSDEGVCSRPRGRHPSLEGTYGADQSVQSQIHLACLYQRTVWTHGHTKHHARLR